MGLFDNFPYTNFHELNLDWILKVLKDIETTIDQFVSLNIIKYADPIQWDITRQYPKNTIVVDPINGTAYISVDNVPQGAPLSNTDYWSVVFDLGRFITHASQNFANSYESVLTTTATMPTPKGHWVIWNSILYEALNDIHVGDAYVIATDEDPESGNIKKTTVESFHDALAAIIRQEIIDRIAAINDLDTSLTEALNQEALTRQSADSALDSLIHDEIQNRQDADSALASQISQETQNRETSDTAINNKIGALSDLNTTDKSNIVSAINEVNNSAQQQSDYWQVGDDVKGCLSDLPRQAGYCVEIQKTDSPLNYKGLGTDAAFIVQHKCERNLDLNQSESAIEFDFVTTGNGYVEGASRFSGGIYDGLRTTQDKHGDGSGHCYSAIGQLRETGEGGYNELGLYQGIATNINSDNGTISGVEVIVRDGVPNGTSHPTALSAVIGRVGKYNPSVLTSTAFAASSEGTLPTGSVFNINPQGRVFQEGFDLHYLIVNSGRVMTMPTSGVICKRYNDTNDYQDIVGWNLNHAWLNGSLYTDIQSNGTTRARIDAGEASNDAGLMIWFDGSLKRVKVGAPDSAGAGYRMLMIPN